MSRAKVIIIGAGFTGVATAHDLALRGVDVTVVERGPIANGTSGRTHGLLHSGCRYVIDDRQSAIECIQENKILREIVPQVIEPNGGLFIAIKEDDLEYKQQFIEGCDSCNISIEELSPKSALKLEPNLNSRLISAFSVPDATFDPLRLALAFAATAKANNARFLFFTEVTGMILDGKGNVKGVKIWDRIVNEKKDLGGDIFINCTGAWAGKIALMGGATIPIVPTPGIMVAYDQRLTQRVVNRLCRPSDGDIVLPQRRMMIAGTTSFEVEDCDYVPCYEDQIRLVHKAAIELIPAIQTSHMRAAYMATRPLIRSGGIGRSLARTFKCYDHFETDGIEGLITITGGKATTMRLMAEVTSDLVCQKLGVPSKCRTKDTALLSYRQFYALQNKEMQ